MQGLMITIVVFGGIILALAILGTTILMALNILKGGASSKRQKTQTHEAQIMQEIYQGLARMEERAEALETILLEREKGRKENEG